MTEMTDIMNVDESATPKKRRGMVAAWLRWIWFAATSVVAILSVIAANGGMISPLTSVIPALMLMAFPALFIANIAAGLITLIFSRRFALVNLAALILSLGGFWDFCPLNLIHDGVSEADSARVVKVLTYNVYLYYTCDDVYPEGYNPTVSYIINSGADIVCLQEGTYRPSYDERHFTPEQLDSLRMVYPYQVTDQKTSLGVLSKYPLTPVVNTHVESSFTGWIGAEAVIDGDTALIVSAHMRSIGLDSQDKANFQNMTEGEKNAHWRSTSKSLIKKLSAAFKARAAESYRLREQLDSLGYRNTIVAGDFNDVEGCYAMRRVAGGKMKSAFARAGLGPEITYHNDRFYFNIDHVLYQGDFKVISYQCDRVSYSDHYPVTATFLMRRR